ncbi:bacteriohemerythrin [Caldicellulosiruptoraceae bacterium PP1]
MALIWASNFQTGIETIDEQHKELIDRVNKLLDACSQGEGKKVLPEVLDFLQNYVVEHFSTEENLMKKYYYPAYLTHKKEHDNFVATFKSLREEIDTKGTGLLITTRVNRLVVDWLKTHILYVDKQLGSYLKDKI